MCVDSKTYPPCVTTHHPAKWTLYTCTCPVLALQNSRPRVNRPHPVYQEAWIMVHKRWGNLYRCLKSTVSSGRSKPDAERWQRKATRRSKCSEHWRAELRNSSDTGDSQPPANPAASLLQFHWMTEGGGEARGGGCSRDNSLRTMQCPRREMFSTDATHVRSPANRRWLKCFSGNRN